MNIIYTTPLHPQSNGIVERSIGTLKARIIKGIEKDPKLGLYKILKEYNNMIHRTTGYSPYHLMFGRKDNENTDAIPHEFETERRLNEIQDAIRNINSEKKKNIKVIDNRQSAVSNLKEGDQVYFKLGNSMTGPGIITSLNDEMHTAVILQNGKLFKRHYNDINKPIK